MNYEQGKADGLEEFRQRFWLMANTNKVLNKLSSRDLASIAFDLFGFTEEHLNMVPDKRKAPDTVSKEGRQS